MGEQALNHVSGTWPEACVGFSQVKEEEKRRAIDERKIFTKTEEPAQRSHWEV